MGGLPVTIRTLDLGADKADATGIALSDEDNPALGVRGVRLSLRQPAAVRHAAARDPARVELRPGAHPGADGDDQRGDRRACAR